MADDTTTLSSELSRAVDIELPLDAAHAATLRVLVTTLAVDEGFSVDEIDDLKLAVSEVFTVLLESCSGGGRAQAGVEPGDGLLTINIASRDLTAELTLDPLATTILTSVADEFTVETTGVTLVKRSTENAR